MACVNVRNKCEVEESDGQGRKHNESINHLPSIILMQIDDYFKFTLCIKRIEINSFDMEALN